MGLAVLVLGLVAFLGGHLLVTVRPLRAAAVERLGEAPYKGLFSLLALIGLLLVSIGYARYRATEWIDVWHPPHWTVYVAQILMWPACICAVAAYSRGDIWRQLQHPLLVAVKLWAVAHLVSNGDLGSIILFGSFLAWAVFDRITLRRRSDPGAPPIPAGGRRNDVIALVLGSVLFLLLGLVFHPLVIGVSVLGRPAF
jgi:uncharacterized membrane protein